MHKQKNETYNVFDMSFGNNIGISIEVQLDCLWL